MGDKWADVLLVEYEPKWFGFARWERQLRKPGKGPTELRQTFDSGWRWRGLGASIRTTVVPPSQLTARDRDYLKRGVPRDTGDRGI